MILTLGQAAWAVAAIVSDKMVRDDAKLARFLNASLAAHNGDFEPMRALVGDPKPIVVERPL